MLKIKRSIGVVAILTAVAVTGVGSAYASGAQTSVRPQASKDTLTVKVTDVGQVWGKVKLTYVSGGKTVTVGTCTKATCTYKTPHGIKLTAKETAVNSATWPYKNFKLKTGGKTTTNTHTSLSFKLSNGKGTLTAVYVLA